MGLYALGSMSRLRRVPPKISMIWENRRNEVRHVGDRLHGSLELIVLNLVQKQREDDRRRETKHNGQRRNGERVGQKTPEVDVVEEVVKPHETDIVAAGDAAGRLIVVERDDQAVHRLIAEQRQIYKHGQNQQVLVFIHLPVAGNLMAQGHFPLFHSDSHGRTPPLFRV